MSSSSSSSSSTSLTSVTQNKRRDNDVMKLMMSEFSVQLGGDTLAAPQSDFYVRFPGPSGSPYEKGVWRVHVTLPAQYPFKSPSIGFCNTIFHPNVDEASGSVCLDVINQTWSPMFDLLNVFTHFLPQLLLYPNAADPLNGAAAALALRDKPAFDAKVREYVGKYASKDVTSFDATTDEHDDGGARAMDEEDELSDMDDEADESSPLDEF